jgi:hypothetical protein
MATRPKKKKMSAEGQLTTQSIRASLAFAHQSLQRGRTAIREGGKGEEVSRESVEKGLCVQGEGGRGRGGLQWTSVEGAARGMNARRQARQLMARWRESEDFPAEFKDKDARRGRVTKKGRVETEG